MYINIVLGNWLEITCQEHNFDIRLWNMGLGIDGGSFCGCVWARSRRWNFSI